MSTLVLEAAYTIVQASSESDDTPWFLLLMGPAGAGGVYWALFQYYRNTNKSHDFENETIIESQPVTGKDHKVDEVRGTERTRIKGDNASGYRSRVKRLN